ncbi:deuterolysin metalloprotease family protein [Moniliophthora roreri MCA 2997]|uniref:deuterolysin n=2 Tax=Moniliophthora roreri TaxID=221103 RepID=V2X9G7_MONRO|nr:deuterolysin metalloprotease family protein [Moniliophthora roreri MCA 2997]KAI3604869.1 deuterolysin metalloprotease family protein [Moniliophthora roreri]
MFKSTFIALALVSTAFAGPTKRSNSLVVDVTGPAGPVSKPDELEFKATVKNTGSEAVKVLKYNTILDGSLPTRSFVVTKDGKEVPFTGVKPYVSLSDVDDSAYVIIPPGESVTVNHNVASLFDFASAGAGTYSFKPVTSFQIAGSEEKVSGFAESEQADVTSNAVAVNVTKQLEKPDILQKRARNICNNPAQNAFINAAYAEGKEMARASLAYMSNYPGSDLYRRYFKNNDPNTVAGVFNGVATENSAQRTIDCSDPYGYCSSRGWIAYALYAPPGNVYVCPPFFSQVPQNDLCTGATTVNNRNQRGAIILHELTHAISGTVDVNYGCPVDEQLNANDQLRNADNYNCFGAWVWQATRCR